LNWDMRIVRFINQAIKIIPSFCCSDCIHVMERALLRAHVNAFFANV
jgi:hypothetical protein